MIIIKNLKNILFYVAIPILIILIVGTYFSSSLIVTKSKYSEVLDLFRTNQIAEYNLNLSNGDLTYYLRDDKDKKQQVRYEVPNAYLFIDDLTEIRKDLKQKADKEQLTDEQIQIKFDYERGGEGAWLLNLMPTLVIIGIMVFFWVYMSKKMGSFGGTDKTLSFGKAKFKNATDEKKKTTFSDVAGADEEKEELQEIVEFLKSPQRFNELGARIPKGVLLVGPPGTGKTLLARAVAGEAGVPFFSISGSDFVEMFVGVGASRVRDLFETAKKNAPSIIFIDEIDAVGRQRGAGLGGGHDEREQTLNQLLVEMDGFGANEGVIIVAATNRPDILDKALLRPGRFDRQITVNYPDVKGREEILKVHARGKPLGPDVNLRTIAKSTAGFTGADLENLLNEAALLAARHNNKAIVEANIEEATIKVVMGTEKRSHVITDRDKKITSYHEAGHAIVSYFLPTQDPVHQISIIPRGLAAGYTMYLPDDDNKHVSKNEMLESICSLLGGRAAESLTLKDVCTGASNDIKRATSLARDMVTKYGFSDRIGPISLGSDQDEIFLGRDFNSAPNYSEKIAAVIDEEIEDIVSNQYKIAIDILKANIDVLNEVAGVLVTDEKIDGDRFKSIMQKHVDNNDGSEKNETVE